MKRIKMLLTAAVVFTVVGGALAFKPYNGTFLCSTVSGTCPTDHLYKITGGSLTRFCNDDGSQCTHQITTAQVDDQ
jgi:hypothetical protein